MLSQNEVNRKHTVVLLLRLLDSQVKYLYKLSNYKYSLLQDWSAGNVLKMFVILFWPICEVCDVRIVL
jgi:hypothetical protein